MGTEKRARQKAGRQARIEAAEAAKRKSATRGRVIRIGVFAAVIVALIAASIVLRRDDETEVATPTPETTESTLPGTTAPPPPCPAADGSSPKTTAFAAPPAMCIDPAKTYTAKVTTTKGDYTIAFDTKAAPLAVNNFVFLARYHFYDGTPIHRIIPDFVVQSGDPTGTGSGGPGYKFADELPANAAAYTKGSVAMANSGPNTNGSQFFIVLTNQWTAPVSYSLFGRVTEGLDTTVAALAAVGTPGDGKPSEAVTTTSVTITES
jgi:cyclophilin family peptidyl-prolyl cis-trans isomerase